MEGNKNKFFNQVKKTCNLYFKSHFIEQELKESRNYSYINKSSIVENIISSIKDIINSKEQGYNIFMELCNELNGINYGMKYSELIKVFEITLKKYDDEWVQKASFYDEEDYERYWPDIAHSIVWDILKNKEKGITPIEWTMRGIFGPQTEKFEAYHIDSETWELLQLYIEDSKGNEEGYEYKCVLDPDISEIVYPYCDCPGEISSQERVKGNYINSNCDTYGTSYGVKAQGLYALFITDLEKFAVAYESYWVY